jgi:hypothetical protein
MNKTNMNAAQKNFEKIIRDPVHEQVIQKMLLNYHVQDAAEDSGATSVTAHINP